MIWPTSLIVPKPLSLGETIAIVSPSWGGPSVFPQRLEAGLSCLRERFGFVIREATHLRADADWLARNPQARADDLNEAFVDPEVSGIIAAIGGDDAVRLEPFLDLDTIVRNPKVLLGYSDTTALHFACLKAGLRSFYGPSVMSGFAENAGISDTTEASFRAMCMASSGGILPYAQEGWTDQHLDWGDPSNQSYPRTRTQTDGPRVLRGQGTVRGRLIGGCIEVLEMLKGTPLWPPHDYWDGKILFLEPSEDAPASDMVRRWMRNYGAQTILSRISGLMLARPAGMSAERREEHYAAILAALDEFGCQNLPVIADLDFGHTDPIITLPYGAEAELNCDRVTIKVSY